MFGNNILVKVLTDEAKDSVYLPNFEEKLIQKLNSQIETRYQLMQVKLIMPKK